MRFEIQKFFHKAKLLWQLFCKLWRLKLAQMEEVVISKTKYLFYCNLKKQHPNAKLLYSFAYKDILVATDDFFLKRAIEIPVAKGNTIICKSQSQVVKIILKE